MPLSATFVLSVLLGCGSNLDAGDVRPNEDPTFGNGANDGDGTAGDDAGTSAPSDGSDEGDGDSGGSVRVRLLHGLVNVGPLTACHDPDRVLDRPDTAIDESSDGPRDAAPIALEGSFGVATAFESLAPLSRGVISFHHLPEASDADAGVPDAGLDDAGVALPCSDATREAELALPFTPEPLLTGELMGTDLVQTLAGGTSVTLLASGLALEPDELERRVAMAEASFLLAHPGDTAGAEAAGRERRVALLRARGVQVVPTLERAASGSIRLAFAHLVPDVPSAEEGSGDLVLCAQAGDRELGQLGAPTSMHFAFRLRTSLDLNLDPAQAHTFRAFAAEEFDAEAKGCAATSLLPVASLTLAAASLQSGRAYTLAAIGALGSDELCAPTTVDVLPREGCAGDAADFAARLVLLD